MGKMNKRNTPDGIIEMCLIFAFRLVLESTILKHEECEELHQMIGNHCNIYPTEWKLLYRASRDGFKMKACHQKCYSHPNVVLIVESKKGNVFGGFTENGWDLEAKTGEYRSDPNAFLYLIRNETHENEHGIFEIKDSQRHYAIAHFKDTHDPWLFTFGCGGTDLYLREDCDVHNNTGSRLDSFAHNGKGSNVLNGTNTFNTTEIELFQLL